MGHRVRMASDKCFNERDSTRQRDKSAWGIRMDGGHLVRGRVRSPSAVGAHSSPFALFVVSIVALASAMTYSRFGARIATGIPIWALVFVQAFRPCSNWLCTGCIRAASCRCK